jgi:hypothetical protein
MPAQRSGTKLNGTPAQHRARAIQQAEKAERSLSRGDYSRAFVDSAIANDEAQWTDDEALKKMTVREFDMASDPEALPRRRPREDTDGLAGLGCACSDTPSGLGGRKRKRKR